MKGNLYKTKLGWTVKYSKNKKNVDFDTIAIPVDNFQNLIDSNNGSLVEFSVKIKKSGNGKMPYAQIYLN